MKMIFFCIFFVITFSARAQKLPDIALSKVRIVEPGQTIVAELDEADARPAVKSSLFYFWYSANIIHSTQGGFSGTLLNGAYTAYYPDKNLEEQGTFKKGLKHGLWKSWNEDGTLKQTTTWKNGLMLTGTPKKFWRKIHFFKHKVKAARPDTLAKPVPAP